VGDGDDLQTEKASGRGFRGSLLEQIYDAVAVEAAEPEIKAEGAEHEAKQACALLMKATEKAPPGSSPGGADGSVRGRH
jgi:hypothetical protein